MRPKIFNSELLQKRLERTLPNASDKGGLFDYTSEQIKERLAEIKRDFANILDLSPVPCSFCHTAERKPSVFYLEDNPDALDDSIYDLIASNMWLHWVNDIPKVLNQIKNALAQDGLFMAAFIGEDSLHELRHSLTQAEISVCGGASPRISPTISLGDASNLLLRSGFKLPVADKESVTLVYEDMFALMRDLKLYGQSNALIERRKSFTKKSVFTEAARVYSETFGLNDGSIPASVDIIYLHGWK